MKTFLAKNKEPRNYYETTLKYLSSNMRSVQDVDGLPFQVIREMARQKNFLNAQEAINEIIDETDGYQAVRNLLEKDRKDLTWKRSQVAKRANELKALLQKAQNQTGLAKNINPWKAELKANQEFFEIANKKTVHRGRFRYWLPASRFLMSDQTWLAVHSLHIK